MKNIGKTMPIKKIIIISIVFLFCTIITVNIVPLDKILNTESFGETTNIAYAEVNKETSAEELLNTYYKEEMKIAKVDTTSRSSDFSRTAKQEESKIEETKYISINEVKISKDMDLTIRTGLSKEDFKTLVANTKADTTKFFYNNSDLIYDLCEKYQINEIFFCGLIAGESGWNIASNHRRTYNYISLMSNGKLIQFSSVEDGLEQAAKRLHDNYLSENGRFYCGKTLAGVKTRFCPASSTWIGLIYTCMSKMV